VTHVGLNCVFLVPGETGGMEVVARELIPELVKAAPDHRFTAFVAREAADVDLGAHEQVVVPVNSASRPQWVLGEQLHLPRLARACDVLHSLASTAPARGPFARVTTIHDLHYLTAPDAHFGIRALGMRALVPLAARRSHRIIAVSEQTKRDIVERLHVPADKVDVVPNGLGRPPAGPVTPEADLRARLDLGDRPVLLSLSAKRPHKNLGRLLEGLALIAPEERPVAVLAGYPTPHEAELRDLAQRLGVEARFPGWLPDADVEGLFALTRVFAFPSLSEGFGLPVLEAMARGVAVACSDIPVLREVGGNTATYFNPHSPADIARAIGRAIPDGGPERAARFSWARAARETLATYQQALASR
jgi:glycosyltransferase involved in cell wall biosynthesis